MKAFARTLFALSILIYSCSPKLVNLDLVKKDIASHYESGEYEKEIAEIISETLEEFGSVKLVDSSAVVFDVDETALSNYEVTKATNFGYVPEIWDRWIEEARAPAIGNVKKLYDFLVDNGVHIIFITGRKDYHYTSTFENLKSAGYTTFDTLIVRMKDEYKLGAVEFKSGKREKLTSKGYKIIGTVGDQWSDLEGRYHGIQIKIPNYIYYIE